MQPASESQLLARRDLASHINLRRWIFTNQHSRESGTNSGGAQGGNFLLELRVDLIANRDSVECARWQTGSRCGDRSFFRNYGSTADATNSPVAPAFRRAS